MGISREVPTPTRRLSITLSSATWEAIDGEAKKQKLSASRFVSFLLARAMESTELGEPETDTNGEEI